ncbi:hypothetical protein INR49_024004 [Caranx melampygus]|nr:hypothetical protein INR49_024004 [Caranx melampygus]
MGNMDMNEIDHFMPILLKREEDAEMTPLVSHGSAHFMWIKHSNLYRIHFELIFSICLLEMCSCFLTIFSSVVAMTKKNANAALVYSFLYKIVQVFKEYFKELEEESIRDNFVTVYELMDEVMDFGFPQTTDSKILQEYITQQGHKLEVGAPRPPATVTNAVSWRSEGIKYRKNEVFMDVIESVNLLVSANGSVLRSEIVGSIKLKVVLSGMPELRLGLNDKVLFEITGREKSKTVELEDVKFHQCVKPLIWIESVIEKFSHSRVEIKARSQFKSRSTANNVAIMVPVPSDADSPKFKTSTGSAKWVPEKNVVQWNIKSFPSDELDAKRPITVNFEIPYFTVSGIQVRYLKIIEKSGYQALPWVRYITQSGAPDKLKGTDAARRMEIFSLSVSVFLSSPLLSSPLLSSPPVYIRPQRTKTRHPPLPLKDSLSSDKDCFITSDLLQSSFLCDCDLIDNILIKQITSCISNTLGSAADKAKAEGGAF